MAHGQLGLAAVFPLHQYILCLVEQDLHLLHVTIDTEANKGVCDSQCSGPAGLNPWHQADLKSQCSLLHTTTTANGIPGGG